MSEWICMNVETPHYGQEFLLFSNGSVQKIVYTLECGDDGDFVVDCHQHYDGVYLDELIDSGAHWMPLPEPPECKQ